MARWLRCPAFMSGVVAELRSPSSPILVARLLPVSAEAPELRDLRVVCECKCRVVGPHFVNSTHFSAIASICSVARFSTDGSVPLNSAASISRRQKES